MGLAPPAWSRSGCPAIVDYAEIGQFIDAPIKTYSSGMRARLGFAIATSVDPDILLLDEVLATGDAAFREKSKQRVLELVARGQGDRARDPRHDTGSREYCNRAILIEKGRIVHQGAPDEVVAIHKEHMAERRAEAKEQGVLRLRTGPRRSRRRGSRLRASQSTRARPAFTSRCADALAGATETTANAAPAARAPRQSSTGRTSPVDALGDQHQHRRSAG